MNKTDLIKTCRYYKGEDKSPFSDYWDTVFWQQEAFFIHKFETGFFGNLNIEEALKKHMELFFTHLSDLHATMDEGKLYRDKYLNIKSA